MCKTKKYEGNNKMKTDIQEYFYSDLGWVDFVLADRKPENTRSLTSKKIEFLVDAGIGEHNRLRVHYRHADAKKVSLQANLRLVFNNGKLVGAEVL
jgi:hypothetical protein